MSLYKELQILNRCTLIGSLKETREQLAKVRSLLKSKRNALNKEFEHLNSVEHEANRLIKLKMKKEYDKQHT